jgi:hypothetical protein
LAIESAHRQALAISRISDQAIQIAKSPNCQIANCKKFSPLRSNTRERVSASRACRREGGAMSLFSWGSWAAAWVAALGSLASLAVWGTGPADGRPDDQRAAEPAGHAGLRVTSPIVHEHLLVFPIVTRTSRDTSGFVTLDQALASGEAVVTEQGAASSAARAPLGRVFDRAGASEASVSELVLLYRGMKPLILLAGEIVSGGKQDRIITTDLIVAPKSDPLPLDVFCVERGRWSAGSSFDSARLMAHPSVREMAAVERNQGRVWAAVQSGRTAATDPSAPPPAISSRTLASVAARSAPTGSYRRIYQSTEVAGSVEPFAAEVERRFARATAALGGERVVGVVIAYGGNIAWSDTFASGELFERYWPKLLRSYVVEALARSPVDARASLQDASAFLQPVVGSEQLKLEPGVYRRREVRRGPQVDIMLDALAPAGLTVHRLRIQRSAP